MSLCKYANALGEPGKGVHSIRLFNIAVVDVLLTIILALVFALFFKYAIKLEATFTIIFIINLVSLFILGIILHKIFCVRTTIDKLLFKN
jgi:ABC-type sugar transport system permease subunit